MNVGALRRRVENELQFGPDAPEWKTDVLDLLNEVQDEILTMHPWTFRWSLYRFATYPDAAVGLTAWDLYGQRAVDVDVSVLGDDYLVYGVDRLLWALNGNYLDASDIIGSTDAQGGKRFLIERAAYGTLGYALYLDPRWKQTGKGASTTTFTVRFNRVALPTDCASIRTVRRVSDRQKLSGWDPVRNAKLRDLDPELTGPAVAWTLDVPGREGPSNALAATAFVGAEGGPARPQSMPYLPPRNIPRAPSSPPTLALQGSEGTTTFTVGTTYEYAYTWMYAGQESGLSESATIEMTAVNLKVVLSALEVMEDAFYGRVRCIYRRTEGKRWERIGVLIDPTTATFDDTDGSSRAGQPLADLTFEGESPGTWLRLWPRPQDFAEYELEYVRRPHRLQVDSDTSEIPEEFQNILVHGAMILYAARNQGFKLSDEHKVRYQQLLSGMRGRYLETEQTEILVKGQMFPQAPRAGLSLATLVPIPIQWEET